MTDRPLRVRIDRLVLQGVDDPGVGDLKELIAERLRQPSEAVSGDEDTIPRGTWATAEAAASRIAHEVRTRIAQR